MAWKPKLSQIISVALGIILAATVIYVIAPKLMPTDPETVNQ